MTNLEQIHKISCKEVALKLGIKHGKSDNYHCFNNAAHEHGDRNPSLVIYDETWGCEGCGIGKENGKYSDNIELVKKYNNIDFQESLIWFRDNFGIEIDESVQRHARRLISNEECESPNDRFVNFKGKFNDLENINQQDVININNKLHRQYTLETLQKANCKIVRNQLHYKLNKEFDLLAFDCLPSEQLRYGNLEQEIHIEGRTDYLTAIQLELDRFGTIVSDYNKTSKINLTPKKHIFIVDSDVTNEQLISRITVNELAFIRIVRLPSKDLSAFVFNDGFTQKQLIELIVNSSVIPIYPNKDIEQGIPEAEAALIIGSLDNISNVMELAKISENASLFDFMSSDVNKLMLKSILSLFSKSISINEYNLTNEFKSNKQYPRNFIEKLLLNYQSYDFKGDFEDYLKVLEINYKRKKTIELCNKTIEKLNNSNYDVNEAIDDLQSNILDNFNKEYIKSFYTPDESANELQKYWEKIKTGKLYDEMIKTGIPELDNAIVGLENGEVYIIGGRPGEGKTSLAQTLIKHVAFNQSIPTAFFSVEMPNIKVQTKQIAMLLDIPYKRILSNSLNYDQRATLEDMMKNYYSKFPFYVDDLTGLTESLLYQKAKTYIKKYGIKIIFVDYIQLMKTESSKDNYERQLSKISKKCKQIAKDFHIPVVVLAQISRDVAKENREPQISDIKHSGAIEEDATVVMLINRPEVRNMNTFSRDGSTCKDRVQVIVRKNRYNEPQDMIMKFDKNTTEFKSEKEN